MDYLKNVMMLPYNLIFDHQFVKAHFGLTRWQVVAIVLLNRTF